MTPVSQASPSTPAENAVTILARDGSQDRGSPARRKSRVADAILDAVASAPRPHGDAWSRSSSCRGSPRTSVRRPPRSPGGWPGTSSPPVQVREETLDNVLVALFAEGHVLIEDYPGVGKNRAPRVPWRGRSRCSSSASSAPPTCCRRTVVGTNVYNQREQRFEFRPGPVVRQHGPRRRDQPRVAEDAVRPARVHAGAQRHRRRAHPRAGAAVHRPRDPEPPVEYEGTYPLPEAQVDRFIDPRLARLPEPGPRGSRCSPTTRRGDRVPHARIGGRRRRGSFACRTTAMRVRASRALRDYVVALLRYNPRGPAGRARREPARGPHAPAGREGAGRCSRAAITRSPTTVQALAEPVLAHRLMPRPGGGGHRPDAGRRRRAEHGAGVV